MTDDALDTADAAEHAANLGREARRRWCAGRGLPLDTTADQLRTIAATLRKTTRRRGTALSAVLALVNSGTPERQ